MTSTISPTRGELSEDHLGPAEPSIDTNIRPAGLNGGHRLASEQRAVSTGPLKLSISSVDLGPEELKGQTPFLIELLRELSGPDRPDYWLGRAVSPSDAGAAPNGELLTSLLRRACSTRGLSPRVENLPVGIAFVIDMN